MSPSTQELTRHQQVAASGGKPGLGIVASFHYDVAYLKAYGEYLPRCYEILDEALDILAAEPDYRFLVEQVILLEEYWKARPEKRADMKRYAAEGRLEVAPGMYVMPDMNHITGEALYRQVQHGCQWLDEHLQIRPRVCYIADCWGHPAQLPQILKQCGYDYYVFWRCMRTDVLMANFRWQGLDGTEIAAHWLPLGYGTLRFPSEASAVNALDLRLSPGTPAGIKALAAKLKRYCGEDTPLLFNGGDMAYPQKNAPETIHRLNTEDKSLGLAFTRLDEQLDQVDWESKLLVTGEFNSAFEGTFTTNIRIKQRNRELTTRILSLEVLAATLRKALDLDAWPILLKQQFHDIICGTISDRALSESLAEFDQAEQLIDAGIRQCESPQGRSCYFNPLPFAREERMESEGRIYRLNLPPMGFAEPVELPVSPTASSLPVRFEADSYTAEIGQDGYMTSLVCAASQTELVNAGRADFGSLAMQVDNGDSWLLFEGPLSGGAMESSLTSSRQDPYDRSGPDEMVNRATIRPRIHTAALLPCEDDSLLVEQKGELVFWSIRLAFTTRIRFRKSSRRIEYHTAFIPQGRKYRIRAAFPTALVNPRQRHEVQFGIQERSTGEHVVQHWADLTDDRAGLAVLNRGTPGASADDGMLLISLFRSVAMEYKTESAGSYQENIPHSFSYAIVPHAPDETMLLVREGQAFNTQPLACKVEPEVMNVPGLEIEGAALASARLVDDNLLVRLYEPTGCEHTATIKLPGGFSRWSHADAFGKPINEAAAIDGNIQLPLAPFQIVSMLLLADTP